MRDKYIYYTTIILSIIGIIMIYSSSYIWAEFKYDNPYKYVLMQSIFLVVGIIIMNVVSKIDYKIYMNKSNLIILVCFILLVLVLIPGLGTVRNGSRSWFGIMGFGIQPSELLKIGLVIFISSYAKRNDSIKRYTSKFIIPLLLLIGIFFFLIMLQPDFGTGIVICVSLISLIFITGCNTSIFIKIGIVGIIGVVILILVAPYRMDRITSFINPWSDPLGSGFQMIQSLYAIGPGGLLGYGFLNSRQKHFYLPEPQTDFIFSIISEEFGFIGDVVIILLFVFLFYRIIKVSLRQSDLFAKYMSFGLSFMLIFQTLLNLSVVVGLVPITGVTLFGEKI